ncbi:acyl-CoA synthetase (AMP-forming)/AMP-acid ligase II [Rhodothalassium salexigens DSM 2132]|uniref:Acyl-CoA synthetase (AMP-forming)/AMP-acid ligase II n=1 Tax=Rhodothalassium salexigens DSM 2132 TaxID=1188247 RepID=A0A4R2P9T1_RHOSA|nr:non-ribosomal peptide synthetase [Rhodothalassium salexigens]MBB4212563.1 acyl-CoA synthetase (AMP-forming)/AMP-acid ligase II/acyl carrier protein [Rhodothalassium salexigens DSM 2132]MBK1640098.1 hypothetical protein [Rhodothalassium salexigens DSM 2132]TCP31108.1 acyl-CoA synthetase (AMP-forming)/AMP-acid ligase II [Rhodothalassium salexigens DSM 2132]
MIDVSRSETPETGRTGAGRSETDTKRTPPPTLLHLLARHAVERPHHIALRHLDGDGQVREAIDYATLAGRVEACRARLRAQVPGDARVIVDAETGIDTVIALLGIMAAGRCAIPVRPTKSAAQGAARAALAERCGAAALVLGATVRPVDDAAAAPPVLPLAAVTAPANPTSAAQPMTTMLRPDARADQTAYIQCTSGTMSAAKAVCIGHANLLANQRAICDAFGHDGDTRVVTWLPHYHDMGLVGTLMQPLFVGATVTFMAPHLFAAKPARWLDAIHRHRATTSGAPTFAYELCVRRIATPPADWDLSGWQVAFVGAEPVRAAVLRAFADRFAATGFKADALFPCYGLAEATLFVTGGPRGVGLTSRPRPDGGGEAVACGTPAAGTRVRIVDPGTLASVAPGRTGEVCIAGPGVAQGYAHDPDATAATFGAVTDADGRAYLRTGDLGFLTDGALHLVGRAKNTVICDGVSHLAEDLEAVAAAATDLFAPGAVAVWPGEPEHGTDDPADRPPAGAATGFCLAGEIARTAWRSADADALAERVAAALIDRAGARPAAVHILPPYSLPRTTSGKPRRHACARGIAAGQIRPLARWTAPHRPVTAPTASDDDGLPNQPRNGSADKTETAGPPDRIDAMHRFVIGWIADVVGLAADQVPSDTPFPELGLDSRDLMELADAVSERLDRDIDPQIMWEFPTPRSFADAAARMASADADTTAAAAGTDAAE